MIRVSVGRGSGIEIQCTDARVPKDASNTCYRIVEKTMRTLRANGRVTVEIEKRLPVQGGLGGASANAVATLLGLERALKKSLAAEDRLRITAEVGSDVPLFLVGGTVLGVGRGEQVFPLEDLPSAACVVVTPEVGVSTPRAFARWDRLCGAGTPARETASAPSASRQVEGSEPAGLRPARIGNSDRPHPGSGELTLAGASDRMVELGRGLSAWLSDSYSGAPQIQRVVKPRRGRAENPLLELGRAGIKNDFEEVVFPEYPELSEGKE